ncbi:MAG: response regulator transcription factor [Candidatus Saccharimonadales bacterium]
MSNAKSVLIVEDEKVLRDVYELIITSLGCTVYTAKNGIEGLKQLKKHKPDIMLLDIFMPVMDGREVLRNLNRTDFPNVKIIVCSNMSDSKVIKEVLDNGADKYVLKSSLGPNELKSLIAAK